MRKKNTARRRLVALWLGLAMGAAPLCVGFAEAPGEYVEVIPEDTAIIETIENEEENLPAEPTPLPPMEEVAAEEPMPAPEPEVTPIPPAVEATEVPTEPDPVETPPPPPTEEEIAGIAPPIFVIDPEQPDEALVVPVDAYWPTSLSLGEYAAPEVMPGDTLGFALHVVLDYMDQPYASNIDAQWMQPLLYAEGNAPQLYDQTIAMLVDYANISLDADALDGLPLVHDSLWLAGDVIGNGTNHGYATLTGIQVEQDALPGTYEIPITVRWRENIPADTEHVFHTTLRFHILAPVVETTPFAGMEWQDGIIVYSYADLRQAIQSGSYSTIYLGYSDENQGTIRFTDGRGTGITRSLTIDGIDPLTGRQMRLVDWNGQDTTNGLYAASSSLAITFRNMEITGHNWYGILYGTGQSGIDLRFERVVFTGRQMTHNAGAGSTVSLTDCTVSITNIGSGSEQEVAETTGVTLYGHNVIRRTGPQDNSLFWIKGSGSRNITVAAGATVEMQTTDYMIFTSDNSNVSLDVLGSLTLTTTGDRGSVTYADQYLGRLTVHRGGQLTIRHQSVRRPTMQVVSLVVEGTLDMQRTASGLPLILLETGGSLTFDNPMRVFLSNDSGGLVRTRTANAPMRWTTQVINRYASGSMTNVWNNADMSAFTVNLTATSSGGNITGVSGLQNDAKGAAIGASALRNGAINLMGDTQLNLGSFTLALDSVFSGKKTVAGSANSGATVEIIEYADSSLESRLQSKQASAANGRFSLDSNPFDSAIRRSSRVYAIGQHYRLTAYTYADAIPSGAAFMEIPDMLVFKTVPLSGEDQLIPRADDAWRIVISGDEYRLLAHIVAPMQSFSGDVLPSGLLFVQNGDTQALTADDIEIAHGDFTGVDDTHIIQWQPPEGLLAHLPAFAGIPGDPYATTIVWTLVDGP